MPMQLELEKLRFGTDLLKRGFAKMQKGGVVMDVTNANQASVAEEGGAVAVMALERVPADIREAGGVARMADPQRVLEIIDAVTIPVMAKARIGHVTEARALESLGVDMLDESEVLTPADPYFHIFKRNFTIPFVCGARSLGEAARRIFEGAAMIRTKGEAGTGNIVEAVRHMHLLNRAIGELEEMEEDEIWRAACHYAKRYIRLLEEIRRSQDILEPVSDDDLLFADVTLKDAQQGLYDTLVEIRDLERLQVVNFAAGGIATPADAALMMHMGCDGVFVGSGIFKSSNPTERGRAIVEAVTHFDDPEVVAEVSKGLGEPMKGLDITELPAEARMQDRGW